jgi:SAM-dependent methyltransferase
MRGQHRHRHRDLPTEPIPVENIAAVYNQAGDDYIAYADGDPEHLFSFEGLHAYADRRLWSLLETKLNDLRATGASSVSLLDAGCGPGTWLRRLVTHARLLGFSSITARGFDVAQAQIETARRMAHDLAELPGVNLTFDVADLTRPLPEPDASVDITLCLYSVLSHLPVARLPEVSAEIARVTRRYFITTVRSVGSTPTIFVDLIEKARHFKLDHSLDRYEIELSNGRRIAARFHLFTACELRSSFAHQFDIEDLCGLDIFHNRFVPDRRWNPASLVADRRLSGHLAQLEEAYARDPCFMERATHLLLVGRSRHIPEAEHQCVQFPEAAIQGRAFCLPPRVPARLGRRWNGRRFGKAMNGESAIALCPSATAISPTARPIGAINSLTGDSTRFNRH